MGNVRDSSSTNMMMGRHLKDCIKREREVALESINSKMDQNLKAASKTTILMEMELTIFLITHHGKVPSIKVKSTGLDFLRTD